LRQNFCEKKRANFENLRQPAKALPMKTDTAHQNHCQPKHKRKTLTTILATRPNQPELMPARNRRQRKSRELENLLAEKILTICSLKNAGVNDKTAMQKNNLPKT